VVLKFGLWIIWKGLSATLVHWDATTWSRQTYYARPNHGIKIVMSLVPFTLLQFYLFQVQISHLWYFSKFKLNLDKAIKWNELLSFSVLSNLVLFTLTHIIDQVCVVWSKFCRTTCSPRLGALTLIINGAGSTSRRWLEVGTFYPNQYKSCAYPAHRLEPEMRTINLLVGVRYETPTRRFKLTHIIRSNLQLFFPAFQVQNIYRSTSFSCVL
jgi:hypothetical protein